MQNIIVATILSLFVTVTSSFAGECANGTCSAPVVVRPVRKVVNVTRDIVVAPFRAVAVVAAPARCCCETVVTDSCLPSTSVTKYQPLRRRVVNRTTNVTVCE